VQRQRRTAVRCEAYGVTDVGRQRKHNEDHVLLRPELDLYVVADGMGGHNAGDVASRLTTTSLRNFYEATQDGADLPPSLLPDDALAGAETDAVRLVAAIRKANRDVHEISQSFRQHHGMGSTVVAVAVDCAAGRIHVAHVGDSRCYRVRAGAIEQLTRDHSLINDAIALKPDLTQEELARLPKNIITRALGMRDDVKVDLRSDDALPGDVVLLCSDGLSGMVTDEQILELVTSARDLREAAESLVARANEAGGTDNITALLLRFDADDGAGDEADGAPAGGALVDDPLEGDTDLDTPPLAAGAARAAKRRDATDGPTIELGTPGARVAATGLDVVPVVLCTKCGAQIEPNNRFCTDCGEPVARA
jgi:protein phosphatase